MYSKNYKDIWHFSFMSVHNFEVCAHNRWNCKSIRYNRYIKNPIESPTEKKSLNLRVIYNLTVIVIQGIFYYELLKIN